MLYELYRNENVKSTPFEGVVLSSLQTCIAHFNPATNQVGEDNQYKAEFKLLTEFMTSVPKFAKSPVQQYIAEIEASKEPVENPIQDIKNYIQIHKEHMPRVAGPKGFALFGTLREQDDQEEQAPPETGIAPQQIMEDELQPHYFGPNFLRVLPEPEEEEPREDGEVDMLNDELDAIWLIPGVVPEPYWDITMCQNFSTPILK